MGIENWVRRVILRGTSGNEMDVKADGSLKVSQAGSDVIIPTDIQSHLQTTIQTHNAVSVANATTSLQTNWVDTDGFDNFSVTLLSDSTENANVHVMWSNDGSTIHGSTQSVVQGSTQVGQGARSGKIETRARYVKLQVENVGTSSHTFSAWLYLKA